MKGIEGGFHQKNRNKQNTTTNVPQSPTPQDRPAIDLGCKNLADLTINWYSLEDHAKSGWF